MLTSVVMPAYNAEAYIADAIGSIQQQSDKNWELLVVDDGSTDRTRDIVIRLAAADPRIRCLPQHNQGVAAARNTALANVCDSTTFVAFLDADDVWKPQALELLTAALIEHPDAVAAHGMGHFVDSNGCPILPGAMEAHPLARLAVSGWKLVGQKPEEPTTFSVLAYRNYIANSAMIVRRSVLNIAGPYDPTLIAAEDYDLWLRVARQGDIVFVPKVILSYRLHSENASANARRMNAYGSKVRWKVIHSSAFTPAQRRTARVGCILDAITRPVSLTSVLRTEGPLATMLEVRRTIMAYVRCIRALLPFGYR